MVCLETLGILICLAQNPGGEHRLQIGQKYRTLPLGSNGEKHDRNFADGDDQLFIENAPSIHILVYFTADFFAP